MKHEAPLSPSLVAELFNFWLPIFDGKLDLTPEALLGHEAPHSRIVVHTQRHGGHDGQNGALAGACLVASSPAAPTIGGLGEVATNPTARRSGIATTLTRQALDDFAASGGQALFLGTVNPAAARIYHRLGWRKLAGANLMLNTLGGASPEEFLVDHFRDAAAGPADIAMPTPADRAPMIPLLIAPHDWQILDFNADMRSTRYAVQDSCLGLYRRYAAIAQDGNGAWFCARTDAAHIVGIATARLDQHGGCQIDAFTHKAHIAQWQALIQAAADWANRRAASPIYAQISAEDEEKRALFESQSFTNITDANPITLAGRQLKTLRLTRQ